MTDAFARARAEQIRRSEAMVEAQRFGPPAVTCTRTHHDEWTMLYDDRHRNVGLYCTLCGATIPPPEAEVGVQVVPLE